MLRQFAYFYVFGRFSPHRIFEQSLNKKQGTFKYAVVASLFNILEILFSTGSVVVKKFL